MEPGGDLPLQRGRWRLPLGQVDLEATRYGTDEFVVQCAARRRDPLAGQWPGFHGLAVPAWGSAPGVLFAPVPTSGAGNGLLVPGVQGREGSAKRILGEAMPLPTLIVGMVDELLHAQIQVGQACGAQFPIDNGAWRHQAALTPLRPAGMTGVIG